MEIAKVFPQYLAHAYADRRYASESLAKLKDCFQCWILPRMGSLELSKLEHSHVTALSTEMLSAGLSINRQYSILMWLKLFLRFCRDQLSLEVLEPKAVILPKRPEPSVVFLTNGEIARALGAISLNTLSGKRLRALVELLLGTGLRISEALALRRRAFDERQEVFTITGKGGKHRKVFVPQRTLRWVTYYLHARHDQSEYLFVTASDHPHPWARADIGRYFQRVRNDAALTKAFTPHVLRHTYCTNLLNNGVDIRFIRDLAGHRDITTTARYYLGVDENKLKELVDTRLKFDEPDSEVDVGSTDAILRG